MPVNANVKTGLRCLATTLKMLVVKAKKKKPTYLRRRAKYFVFH